MEIAIRMVEMDTKIMEIATNMMDINTRTMVIITRTMVDRIQQGIIHPGKTMEEGKKEETVR